MVNNPDPNAEQPQGGQDYAKWAATLGPIGVAALLGMGPKGRGVIKAAEKYFPEWAQYLHNLPAPSFLAVPQHFKSAAGDAEILKRADQSPDMLRMLQRAGAPTGEQWRSPTSMLPVGRIRLDPQVYDMLGEGHPRGVSILAHELQHMEGGLESLSSSVNNTGQYLSDMQNQAANRLYPDLASHTDELMAALANPDWKDLQKMYSAYRETSPGAPAVPPSGALREVLTEALARQKTMRAMPGVKAADLVTKWKSGRLYDALHPEEFQDQLRSMALQRLQFPQP